MQQYWEVLMQRILDYMNGGCVDPAWTYHLDPIAATLLVKGNSTLDMVRNMCGR